LSIIYVI